MSVPRGRYDIRAKDQSVGIPERHAPISERSRSVRHYNRLELVPLNRVSPAAMHPTPPRTSAKVQTSSGHDRQVSGASARSWINSFLVHQGDSCNKQVSGATRLRRGIAQ
jgi:hypothetical protein